MWEATFSFNDHRLLLPPPYAAYATLDDST